MSKIKDYIIANHNKPRVYKHIGYYYQGMFHYFTGKYLSDTLPTFITSAKHAKKYLYPSEAERVMLKLKELLNNPQITFMIKTGD